MRGNVTTDTTTATTATAATTSTGTCSSASGATEWSGGDEAWGIVTAGQCRTQLVCSPQLQSNHDHNHQLYSSPALEFSQGFWEGASMLSRIHQQGQGLLSPVGSSGSSGGSGGFRSKSRAQSVSLHQ